MTTTKTVTVRERLEDLVAADLAQNGLTLVLSDGADTDGDAWSRATDQHGPQVVNIHFQDGDWTTMRYRPWGEGNWEPATALKVSYPYGDTAAGEFIAATLDLHGFPTTWDGDGESAIFIRL